MMEHNGLDLIYILDTPRWDQNWIKVMEKAEPVVFVASADSDFAGKTLKLNDILEEPFFLTERNANYRQALDQQLALKKQALSPVLFRQLSLDGFRFFYGYSSAVSSLEAFMITAHCLHPCATKDSPSARLSQTPWEVKRKNSLSFSLT